MKCESEEKESRMSTAGGEALHRIERKTTEKRKERTV